MTSGNLERDIRAEFNRAFGGANRDIDRAGRQAGQRFGRGFGDGSEGSTERALRRDVNRSRPQLHNIFGTLGKDLGKEFNLGIGAARMGEAVVGALVLAGPSIISTVGTLLTSLASEIVTFAAAIGPGLTGALGLGAAGLATLGLNLGLLHLAFSGTTDSAKAFKDQVKDFKSTLTAAFAPGVLSGFSDLLSKLKSDLLPAINDLLGETGTAMGDVARGIGETVTSGANLGRIQGILRTNITFLGNFKTGLQGLTSAFLILFNAAKPLVDFIGQGIAKFGQWAENTLAAKEASGELNTFMDKLLKNFQDLMTVLGNFGSGIANVFRAAAGPGKSLFDSIAGMAERFKAWTSDEANMARMTAFLDKAHHITSGIFTLLGKIFVAGGKAFEKVDTAKIDHFFQTLGDIGSSIGQIFSQIKTGAGDNLARILDDIATILDRIAASKSAENFASAISSVVLAISDLAVKLTSTPIGAQILGIAFGLLLFKGLIMTALTPILALGSALAGVGAAAALTALGVLALVGFFIAMWTQSENLRHAIGDQLQPTLDTLSAVWDKIQPKIQPLIDSFLRLAGAIGDRLAPVITALWPTVLQVFTVIGGIITFWLDLITGLFNIFADLLEGNWTKLWEDLKTLVGNVVSDIGGILQGAWDLIWRLAIQPVIDFNDYLTRILGPLPTFALGVWNDFYRDTIQPIQDTYNDATGFIGRMIDGITRFLEGIPSFAAGIWNDFYSSTIQPIQDTYNTATRIVGQMIDGITNWIEGWSIGSIGSMLYDAIVQPFIDTWNNITGWVSKITGALGSLMSANSALAAAQATNTSLTGAGTAPGVVPGGTAMLAMGGIVSAVPGGVHAILAERGRDERVEPLDSQGLSRRDRALINQIVNTMMTSNQGPTGAGPMVVQVRIGDKEISDVFAQAITASDAALAKRIKQRRRM